MEPAFALYDPKDGRYVTYNPYTQTYSSTTTAASLKIWDVWDAEMIPHIEADPEVPKYLKIKQLKVAESRNLHFLR